VFAEAYQVPELHRVFVESGEWKRCGLPPIQRTKDEEGMSNWESKDRTPMAWKRIG
jgi:hypothetical protein